MFENAKTILQEKDQNGNSVYEHLISVVQEIIESKTNCYDDIEQISKSIKTQKIPKSQEKFENLNPKEKEELQEYILNILQLSGKEVPSNEVIQSEEQEEEAEEPVEVDPTKILDIMKNVQMLQWSGIDFGNDWWHLQCACYNLAKQFPKIIEPRFFGKIFGIGNDYWIVESKLEEYPELENQPANAEIPGEGLNKYVYFVCTNLEKGEWSQLPYVTPEALQASKECRVHVKGNLNASIGGRYRFPGKESLYLRCLIDRIASSTILVPENYFVKEEESEALIQNEEFVPSETVDLNSWVHARSCLRKDGRLTRWIDPEIEENEEAQPVEDDEPSIDLLRSINEDRSDIFTKSQEEEEEKTNMWYIREQSKTMLRPYEIHVIKNKLWTGAMTCFEMNSNNFMNLYIGDGLQFLNKEYQPQRLLTMQQEFNEFPQIQNPENEEEMITSTESMFKECSDPLPPPPEEPVVEENTEATEENAEASVEDPENTAENPEAQG